ncbi:hypothetical protein HK104_010925 [Borealophlyctis nickersoniae]|nr:hypothetical protein HK104_010925 [Borealophlyctis nickersoniae]
MTGRFKPTSGYGDQVATRPQVDTEQQVLLPKVAATAPLVTMPQLPGAYGSNPAEAAKTYAKQQVAAFQGAANWGFLQNQQHIFSLQGAMNNDDDTNIFDSIWHKLQGTEVTQSSDYNEAEVQKAHQQVYGGGGGEYGYGSPSSTDPKLLGRAAAHQAYENFERQGGERDGMGPQDMIGIHAQPYAWPFDGNLSPENTALIIIDMQVWHGKRLHAQPRTMIDGSK